MKPILFSTEMVQAILAGRKTQTRRVIKAPVLFNAKTPDLISTNGNKFVFRWNGPETIGGFDIKPPYNVGHVLWVRETWQHAYLMDDSDHIIEGTGAYLYAADGDPCFDYWVGTDTGIHKENMPWKPSIHMPREAARLFLRVVSVRVERVQDITDGDALKEGCEGAPCEHPGYEPQWGCTDCYNTGWREPPQVEFQSLWDNLYAKRGHGWGTNPFVWVIEFEKCDPE